jgi:hypothetical protein
LPAQAGVSQLPPQIIPLLGQLMDVAEQAQDKLRTSQPADSEVDGLTSQLGQLLDSVSYGRVLIARAPTLGSVLRRLTAARGNPEQLVALLSELRLALDSALGFGSLDLRQNYQDAFKAYAANAEERIAQLAGQQDSFEQILGKDAAEALMTMVDNQRGALALLRDEVSKGRLSKSQLSQRIRVNRGRAEQAASYAYSAIDGAACKLVDQKLPSAQAVQELLRCKLGRLLTDIWPDM